MWWREWRTFQEAQDMMFSIDYSHNVVTEDVLFIRLVFRCTKVSAVAYGYHDMMDGFALLG